MIVVTIRKSREKVSNISVNNFIFIRNKIYISSKEEINLNFSQICIIVTFYNILTYDDMVITLHINEKYNKILFTMFYNVSEILHCNLILFLFKL